MKIKQKLQLLTLLAFFQVSISIQANPLDTAPIPLIGGDVGPNQILKIKLKSLINNRYYKITCDIENPNYPSPDPVVVKLTGGWSVQTNPAPPGGIGKITLNGHELSHSQALANQFENKYVVLDVWFGNKPSDSPNSPILELRFENYHTTDSITVKNCFADYMV